MYVRDPSAGAGNGNMTGTVLFNARNAAGDIKIIDPDSTILEGLPLHMILLDYETTGSPGTMVGFTK